MKFVWRMLGVMVTMGIFWAMCEYISTTFAIVGLAGCLAMVEVDFKERLDGIGKALEMHSKKLFPELWD